jgi:hypothetical protein
MLASPSLGGLGICATDAILLNQIPVGPATEAVDQEVDENPHGQRITVHSAQNSMSPDRECS